MKRTVLAELKANHYDLLIIGGGVTGASTFRDAALRGLKVALVEKNDFAWGTSSRSTKLLHGGLRYLESYQFRMVRESCRERELMLKLAPHLAHPRPFLYLQYEGYPEGMLKLRLGLTLYDLFAGAPASRRHKMLDREATLRLEPHLNAEGLKGCGYYYDFLTDDARFTIETVKGAVQAGGHAANYMEVVDFVLADDRIVGATIRDHLSGEEGEVFARQVINCGGPWVDKVRFLEPNVSDARLRPTKGVHIVLSKADFPLNHAIFLRSPTDNRVVWPIPALDGDLVYIGTTDTDYQGSVDHVVATEEDVDYLLAVANQAIPGRNLGREHVISTWAGLRPLIAPEDARDPSAVSREHEIFMSPQGLLTVGGGKLTTARVMGKDVVDRAVALLPRLGGPAQVPASTTERVPLSGGDPEQLAKARNIVGDMDLQPALWERLLGLYASNVLAIAETIAADPALGRDLGHGVTRAEVRYAVAEEMACTLTDFFTRRASLFYWVEDGGASIAAPVADEMAGMLRWNVAEKERQQEAYRAWVAENRIDQAQTGVL